MSGEASQQGTATRAQLETAYALAVAELRACLAAMREIDATSESVEAARRRAIEASITARKAQAALLHFAWSPVSLDFLRVEERVAEEVHLDHRPHLTPEPFSQLRGLPDEFVDPAPLLDSR
ncbi:MAG: hypothetical protein ACO1SV_00465 [Fimbriimonas sp.]